MRKSLFYSLLICIILFPRVALSQSNDNINGVDLTKRVITPVDTEKYEIREFYSNDVPVFIGSLCSVDPLIRDGKYVFYDSSGNEITTGNYTQGIPAGMWVYFDSNKDTLQVIDYQSVADFLEEDNGIIPYDTMAMESLSRKSKKLMKEGGIFMEVDELPLFDGHVFTNSFSNFVRENLILPVYAEKYNLADNVIISFTLDYEGNIRNPEVLQTSLIDLSTEAIRVLLESREKWEPAKVENKAVNVRFTWEFIFRDAQEYNSIWSKSDKIADDTTIVNEEIQLNDTTVYYIVEQMPTFNNGDPAIEFRKFVASELVYPREAIVKGYQGRVIVQFTVDSRGVVCNPTIVKGVHPLLDSEAIRVVMASPRWTPGRQRGKAVSVLFTFPVNFAIGPGI